MFRRAVLATVRFVFDWRTWLMLCASLIVALTIVVVVVDKLNTRDALDTAKAALTARDATAASATRRIDLLTAEIKNLEGDAIGNGARIGELEAQVSALEEQVRQEGGKPIVATTTTTTRSPSTTTTTTTRPWPNPTTSTTRPCRQVAGICIGGRP